VSILAGLVTAGLVTLAMYGGAPLALGIACLLLGIVAVGPVQLGAALVIAGFFFAPMNAIGPSSATSAITFADLFFAIGFPLLLPAILRRHFTVSPLYALGVTVLLVAGSIACLFAGDVGRSVNEFSRLVIAAVFLPLAVLAWHPERRNITALALAYVHGTLASFACGIATGTKSVDGRYAGLAEHPNALGLTAMFSLGLAPYLYSTFSQERRWYAVALGVASLGAVWASGSRAALLVSLLLIVLFLVVERSTRATLWVLALGGVAIAFSGKLLAADTGGNALARLLGAGSANASDASRTARAQAALDTIREHPLVGTGFEDTLIAHVIYLQVFAAGGVFTFLAVCVILGEACRPLLSSARPLNQLCYPAVAYVLVGLITNALWDRYIWAPLAIALLVAAHTSRGTSRGVGHAHIDQRVLR
jgi:hypothetical protein